jgi:hypothetical protein
MNAHKTEPHCLVAIGKLEPDLFQNCFVVIGKWFLEGNIARAKGAGWELAVVSLAALFAPFLRPGFLRCGRCPGSLSRQPLGLEPLPCSVIAFSASTWRNALRASRSALVIGLVG